MKHKNLSSTNLESVVSILFTSLSARSFVRMWGWSFICCIIPVVTVQTCCSLFTYSSGKLTTFSCSKRESETHVQSKGETKFKLRESYRSGDVYEQHALLISTTSFIIPYIILKFNHKQTIQRIIIILMPIEPETLQVFFIHQKCSMCPPWLIWQTSN